MKTLPVVGKQYTDRSGFTVTVTAVVPSGGGAATFGGNTRKGKKTGYRVEVLYKGTAHKLGLQQFEHRGFKEDGTVS